MSYVSDHGRSRVEDGCAARRLSADARIVTLALATILTLIVARERRAVLRGSMRLDR